MKRYPEILNQTKILKELCYKRLETRIINCDEKVKERLKFELSAIHDTNLEGILLCLQKVVENLGIKPYRIIPRGLMGSSLVVYLLGLTSINPLDYNLNPYLCFGINNIHKELDIDINIDGRIKEKFITEFENLDCKCKLINAQIRDDNGNRRECPNGYLIVPMREGSDDIDMKIIEGLLKFRDWRDLPAYYKIDILPCVPIEQLINLEKSTGVDSNTIITTDKDVLEYINNDKTADKYNNVFCLDNQFIKNICNIIKPKNFNDLIKIVSLANGTNVWNDNFDNLYKEGKLSFYQVLSNREDYFDILVGHGFSNEEAFTLVENIRKGKGTNVNNDVDYKELFKSKGLPDWFYDSCNQIKYLIPKAVVVNYLMVAWKLLWYNIHYPEEYLNSCIDVGM